MFWPQSEPHVNIDPLGRLCVSLRFTLYGAHPNYKAELNILFVRLLGSVISGRRRSLPGECIHVDAMSRFRIYYCFNGYLPPRFSCKPSAPTVLWRHRTTVGSVEKEEAKPFDAIPREKGLPYFGTFLKTLIEYRLKTFLAPFERIKKHGNIWREQTIPGEKEAVHVVDYKDVQEVFRAEGKMPHRLSIPGFQDVRTASAGSDGELGVLFS